MERENGKKRNCVDLNDFRVDLNERRVDLK